MCGKCHPAFDHIFFLSWIEAKYRLYLNRKYHKAEIVVLDLPVWIAQAYLGQHLRHMNLAQFYQNKAQKHFSVDLCYYSLTL